MAVYCTILKLKKVNNESEAIMAFSEAITPHVGEFLKSNKNSNCWKILGIGLPVRIEFLSEKIIIPYGSELIWHCLLKSDDNIQELSEGDELELTIDP